MRGGSRGAWRDGSGRCAALADSAGAALAGFASEQSGRDADLAARGAAAVGDVHGGSRGVRRLERLAPASRGRRRDLDHPGGHHDGVAACALHCPRRREPDLGHSAALRAHRASAAPVRTSGGTASATTIGRRPPRVETTSRLFLPRGAGIRIWTGVVRRCGRPLRSSRAMTTTKQCAEAAKAESSPRARAVDSTHHRCGERGSDSATMVDVVKPGTSRDELVAA